MRKRTKQTLGILGLAGVLAMTAVACAIPSPDANALAYGSADTTVKVTVKQPGNTMSIIEPKKTNVVKGGNVVLAKTSYHNLLTISYDLSCTDEEGVTRTATAVSDVSATGDNYDIDEVVLDIGERAGVSTCLLSAVGVGYDEGVRRELTDQVSFQFRDVSVNVDKAYNDFGDPQVTVNTTTEVDKVSLQVYDSKGRPVFVDASGREVPVVVPASEFTEEDGTLIHKLFLPMHQYGAKAGRYDLVTIGYNGDEVFSMNVNSFDYDPNAPGLPGTGSITKEMNISRTDYILTGIIAFGLVAGFALRMLARKAKAAKSYRIA